MTIWKRILFFLILAGAIMAAVMFGQDLMASIDRTSSSGRLSNYLVRDSIIVVVTLIVAMYAGAKVLS